MIGYDLLNEPFGDEVTEIGPLYADVAQRIRKHDPDGILFIEPQVACMRTACRSLHNPLYSGCGIHLAYLGACCAA